MDPLIRLLQVTSNAQFDQRGTPTPATQYSYYILDHGPFLDVYARDADTLEAVQAKMQERINKLRALGAIT